MFIFIAPYSQQMNCILFTANYLFDLVLLSSLKSKCLFSLIKLLHNNIIHFTILNY